MDYQISKEKLSNINEIIFLLTQYINNDSKFLFVLMVGTVVSNFPIFQFRKAFTALISFELKATEGAQKTIVSEANQV